MIKKIKYDAPTGFEEWGDYMSAKISKLNDQYQTKQTSAFDKKESDLFKGVSIFVNGLTTPSATELKQIMAVNGGTFHHYYMNGVTQFVVASNLPDVKTRQFSPNIKVIRPEWITDCLQAKKLVDWKKYLLIARVTPNQGTINFNKPDVTSTVTKTAVDPNFLTEFYNKSRLHLISELGATFKQYINDLRSGGETKRDGNNLLQKYPKTTEKYEKVIMHIDMDCFFVSVGLRTRPELTNKPIAVTHGNSNSTGKNGGERSMAEVASCSYEARRCGVKNGMYVGQAVKLCPSLVTIPYDFDEYKRVAYTLYDTVARYTLDIEAVSCDEMYVDVTSILSTNNITVDQFATHIRSEIYAQTGCTCSTGFGSNRLQARLATRKAKPNGQFYLTPDMVSTYFQTINVSDLPGVGYSLQEKMKTHGIVTCGDLRDCSLRELQNNFGNKNGAMLYAYCRGDDVKELSYEHVRKSVSADVNYGIRFTTVDECETFLKQLSCEVWSRLKGIRMVGKTVSLKLLVRAKDAPYETKKYLGCGVCDQIVKTGTLIVACDQSECIAREVISMFKKSNVPPCELRGIGIQITNLLAFNNGSGNRSVSTIEKFLVKKTSSLVKENTEIDVKNDGKKNGMKKSEMIDSRIMEHVKMKSETVNKNESVKKKRGRPKKSPGSVKDVSGENKKIPKLTTSSSVHKRMLEKDKPTKEMLLNERNSIERSQSQLIISSDRISKTPMRERDDDTLAKEELRELCCYWFSNTSHEPQLADAELVADCLVELVKKRQLDVVLAIMNYLYRYIKEKKDAWASTWRDMYAKVNERVQCIMVDMFKYPLDVKRF